MWFPLTKLNVPCILATTKSHCYNNNKIKECKGNQRTVFGIVNKVLCLNQTVVPKITTSNKTMAHVFYNFYQKVNNILSSLCFMK